MKKKHLAEMIENLESRVQFLESRLTRAELRIPPVSPVAPIQPTIPPPANDVTRCIKCGSSGMDAYVCTRSDCPAKITVTCSNTTLDDIS